MSLLAVGAAAVAAVNTFSFKYCFCFCYEIHIFHIHIHIHGRSHWSESQVVFLNSLTHADTHSWFLSLQPGPYCGVAWRGP
jgi:hypothetical protein